MKWDPISRRHFLQGVGGVTLALPLLPSLLSGKSAHAAAAAPKRLITLWCPNGKRNNDWYPQATPAWNVLSTTQNVRDTPLSQYSSTGISKVLGPSLNPYLSKITLLRGLDHIYELGHNQKAILGNFDGNTPTIDQLLAKSGKFYPYTPAIANLMMCDPYYPSSCTWDFSGGRLVQLPAFSDPVAAYNRIFFAPDTQRISGFVDVLNFVFQDYLNLKSNRRLGSNDRATLENHMSLLTDLKSQIQTMQAPIGTIPGQPTAPADLAARYKASLDLIVAAIRTGCTRVASFRVEQVPGVTPGQWHGVSHDSEWDGSTPIENPTHLQANQWVAQNVFGYLMSQLDVPEADGKTYLDNSLIYWSNEISSGKSHHGTDVQAVLGGGFGGTVQTGRYIDYTQPTVNAHGAPGFKAGRPYNQFLVSILQKAGLTPSDYERDGNPGYGASVLNSVEGIKRMALYKMDEVGNPLPFL